LFSPVGFIISNFAVKINTFGTICYIYFEKSMYRGKIGRMEQWISTKSGKE